MLDPMDDSCYDDGIMDTTVANLAERNESQLQVGASESPQDNNASVEHEKTTSGVEDNEIDCEEDSSKRGKFKTARDNLKRINVMVKSKIDGLGRVNMFGGRKKYEKQKEPKLLKVSTDNTQTEVKPPPSPNEAASQYEAGAIVRSAAANSISYPDILAISLEDPYTGEPSDGSLPVSGHDLQEWSSPCTSDISVSDFSTSSQHQSSEITDLSSEINKNDLICFDEVPSPLEATSAPQSQNSVHDVTDAAGTLNAHHSSSATSGVLGGRTWADSIKSTASSVATSVNRGCLEGTGPAVPVDFVNPHISLARMKENSSDYNSFYFHSIKSVLSTGQTGLPENEHDSPENPESVVTDTALETNTGDSDVERLSESEDDFWGSEFDESSSQDEVLLDDRGYDIDETPDKPLPPKPGKKVFFLRTKVASNDSASQDESGSCLPVTINLQKHPHPALPPAPSGLTQNQIKRRLVIESIISSERSYLDSLERLVKDYEKTLLEFIPQPKSHVRRVFSKMREIIGHHKMFQIELSERVKLWDEEEKIGDIFTASFSKTMLINAYSVYVNNFAAAMDEVRLLQRARQTFQDFLQKQEKNSADRLSIFGLMVKPVQRFPQFIMFLQDLIKLTPQSHDDRRALQLALTELENVAYRLNERKRQSEQKFQARQTVKMLIKQKVQHVLDTWNLDVDHKRRLIRTDSVEHMHGDVDNLKCKDRRLILMNDHVLCVKVIHKEISGFEVERYALRWVDKLKDLELKDTSITCGVQSILGRESSRIPISQSLGESEDDPFHLLADLHDIAHDHEIIKQMSALVSRLRRSYAGHGLREELIHEISNDLQQMIQVKEEQLRLVNSCTVVLEDTARSDKPHRVLQMATPALKLDWCIDFLMAKLALDKSNNLAWDGTSGSDGGDFDVVPAYFLKYIPVDVPKNYTSIKCAVSVYLNSKRPASGLGLQHLWVCSSTPTHGQVSILSVHNSKPALVESFRACGSDILAVELVPGCGHMTQPGKLLFAEDTVWMATSQNEILIFPLTSEDGVRRQPLTSIPASHTTVSIKFVDEQFFCGSSAGILTIYTREPDGSWNISNPTALSVGSSSVKFHFVYQQYMWVSSGSRLSQLEIDSLQVESVSVLQVSDESHIDHVVKSGVGIWVSFCGHSVIKLFHLETMENLQEISVGNFVSRIITEKSWTISGGSENLAVTALAVSRGFLWIGTSCGVMLTVPLPRLSDGVPLYRGSPKLSLHAHKGPVRFLHLLQCSSGVVEMKRASSLLSTIETRQSHRNLERKRLELETLQQRMRSTGIDESVEIKIVENLDVSETESNQKVSRFSNSVIEDDQEKLVGLSGTSESFGLNVPMSNRQSVTDKRESWTTVDDNSVQLRNKRRSSESYRRSKTLSPSLDLVHRNMLKSKVYSQSHLDLNSAEPSEVGILYRALLDDLSGGQEFRYSGETGTNKFMGERSRRWSYRASSQMSNSHISTPSWLMTSPSGPASHSSSQESRHESPLQKVESQVESTGGITESHRNHATSDATRLTESGTADRKQFSKASSNAVIVVSGGDGYCDLDLARRETKMDDACVMMWIHKFY